MAKVVEDLFVRVAPTLGSVVCNRNINTTAEHPFYLLGQGWRCAKELQAGDWLISHERVPVRLEEVRETAEVATVYNLRVADYHTYFVGCQEWGFSVWAHNAEYGIIRRGNTAFVTDEAGNFLKDLRGQPVQFNEGNWESSLAKARRHIESQPEGRVGSVNARDQSLLDPHNNKPSMQQELFKREQAQNLTPKRITNPKHHPKSVSPGPKNVAELFDKAIVDSNGVRWAKDADGTIHRFSKPSNGETHWNGSTSGVDPIKLEEIPIDIRNKLK